MEFFSIKSKDDMLQFVRENEPRLALVEIFEWIANLKQVQFDGPQQGIPVSEMIRNWSIRHERMLKRGEAAAGTAELLERLRTRSPEERVQVVGYYSTNYSLNVIAAPDGKYLGFCRLVPPVEDISPEFERMERAATAWGSCF